MSVKSYEDQLTEVQKALFEVMTKGEEVELEFMGTKKKYKRSNLKELQEYEGFLRKMVNRAEDGGVTQLRIVY